MGEPDAPMAAWPSALVGDFSTALLSQSFEDEFASVQGIRHMSRTGTTIAAM